MGCCASTDHAERVFTIFDEDGAVFRKKMVLGLDTEGEYWLAIYKSASSKGSKFVKVYVEREGSHILRVLHVASFRSGKTVDSERSWSIPQSGCVLHESSE